MKTETRCESSVSNLMEEPIWVSDAVVATVHRIQLAEHGGDGGVRDAGLLSSALLRPKNLLHYVDDKPDMASLAAAYAFGIANDGNKRTAWVTCRTFLKLNGYDVSASQEDKFLAVDALADGLLDEEGFATWLREKIVEIA